MAAVKRGVAALSQVVAARQEADDSDDAGFPQLMTAEDLAAYLRITPNYVYKLVARDQLPCIHLGARVIFRRDAIDRFLQERETTPVRR